MNTFLWILQIILCIKFLTASITHAFQQNKPTMQRAIQTMGYSSRIIHPVSAILMLLGSLGLVLPAASSSLAWLAPLAAAWLAVLNLISLLFHIKFREKPLLFAGVFLFAMSAFVAYGRWAISPL